MNTTTTIQSTTDRNREISAKIAELQAQANAIQEQIAAANAEIDYTLIEKKINHIAEVVRNTARKLEYVDAEKFGWAGTPYSKRKLTVIGLNGQNIVCTYPYTEYDGYKRVTKTATVGIPAALLRMSTWEITSMMRLYNDRMTDKALNETITAGNKKIRDAKQQIQTLTDKIAKVEAEVATASKKKSRAVDNIHRRSNAEVRRQRRVRVAIRAKEEANR